MSKLISASRILVDDKLSAVEIEEQNITTTGYGYSIESEN